MEKLFKGAKKISCDKNSSCFALPNGHKITVAHNSLSKEMRAQLDKLPIHAAEGVDTQKYDPGSADEMSGIGDAIDSAAGALAGDATSNRFSQKGSQDSATNRDPASQPTGFNMVEDAKTNPAPGIDPAAANAPVQATPGTEAEDLSPDKSQQVPSLFNPAISPDDHKTIVQNDIAKESANIDQDLKDGKIDPLTYHKLLWQEQQPDGSWKDKGTLGKISTMFGLMLGGMGSGLTHQPNAIMQMMDNTIGKNLDAQKASKTNAQNIYKLQLEHQMNESQMAAQRAGIKLTEQQTKLMSADAEAKAYNISRIKMNSSVLDNAVKLYQSLPDNDPRKAQAQQTIAMMAPAVNAENANLASVAAAQSARFKAMMGDISGGSGSEQQFQQQNMGRRMMGPEGEKMAEVAEGHHMPGFSGRSSTTIQPEDRQFLQTGTDFQNQLDNFIDWTKNHSGKLSLSDYSEGRAKAADLQGAYRQATRGGVYKEGEQNFISKLIDPDPTKFFNSIRVVPSLKAISDDNKRRIGDYTKGLGLGEYTGGAQKQASNSLQEGQTGTHKGKPVVVKNGKWTYK
jgi:hypothetical protein